MFWAWHMVGWRMLPDNYPRFWLLSFPFFFVDFWSAIRESIFASRNLKRVCTFSRLKFTHQSFSNGQRMRNITSLFFLHCFAWIAFHSIVQTGTSFALVISVSNRVWHVYSALEHYFLEAAIYPWIGRTQLLLVYFLYRDWPRLSSLAWLRLGCDLSLFYFYCLYLFCLGGLIE